MRRNGWSPSSHQPGTARATCSLSVSLLGLKSPAATLWPWQASALTAPLCWLAAGFVATVLLVRRLRLA
jgi:hypothetical protein